MAPASGLPLWKPERKEGESRLWCSCLLASQRKEHCSVTLTKCSARPRVRIAKYAESGSQMNSQNMLVSILILVKTPSQKLAG